MSLSLSQRSTRMASEPEARLGGQCRAGTKAPVEHKKVCKKARGVGRRFSNCKEC